jgi:hypothetical protein
MNSKEDLSFQHKKILLELMQHQLTETLNLKNIEAEISKFSEILLNFSTDPGKLQKMLKEFLNSSMVKDLAAVYLRAMIDGEDGEEGSLILENYLELLKENFLEFQTTPNQQIAAFYKKVLYTVFKADHLLLKCVKILEQLSTGVSLVIKF